ncbi:hypothetical protein QFC21_002360 [Naganishia friedmannii]|uniref:Uncharacterized protein n=1 Tax=Naganishia friedmannii TaxID=89922 RepID=A0ACC2VX35_9TREE|nr:hypothetical protein QFC21_002360 [Naganishia friedmannii]
MREHSREVRSSSAARDGKSTLDVLSETDNPSNDPQPYGYFDMHQPNVWKAIFKAFLATALFRITTSAYERYWEGRRLWSQIIINARTMTRLIWVHCPDTMVAELPEGGWESKQAEEDDRRKAVKEKRRAIELCLAFAVAAKHFPISMMPIYAGCSDLRGEEGIFYEDLYPLVKFLPSYNLPSGIPPPEQAYNDQNQSVEHLRSRSATPAEGGRDRVADTPMNQSPVSTLRKLTLQGVTPTSSVAGFAGMHKVLTASAIGSSPYSLRYNQPFSQPKLRPARCPPRHHWSEAVPIRYLPFAKNKRMERKLKQALYADSSSFLGGADGEPLQGSQTAQNIPLELTMYMASHFPYTKQPFRF